MDNVWDLLKEYDFLLTNRINIDFVCILCKKILIDAKFGPCGCRFCKICIENYLENGENICPGSTDECKEEKLNLIENISIDHFINRKITKLKLNCPIENCTFSDEMRNMEQHLIVCREIAIKCPFSEIGCNFISLSGDNVDKHCKISKDKHLELVLSKIDLLNKWNTELQQENEKSESDEIEYLINEHETSSDERNTNYNQLKEKNATLRKQVFTLLNKSKQIDDCKSKYENEIDNKNNLIKYLSGYLIGNQTEFIWKINNFSEIKTEGKYTKSDKFFIFKEDIWMELSIGSNVYRYDDTYKFCGKVSHHNVSLNSCCPFICDITMGIADEITGNFILSFDEKKTFDNSGISFRKELSYVNQIKDEIINNCLTVKCLIKLSL